MFKFSNSSKQKLSTCDSDLQSIFNLAIKRSKIDFGIAEGHRTIERQQELFAEGKQQLTALHKKVNTIFPRLWRLIFTHILTARQVGTKNICVTLPALFNRARLNWVLLSVGAEIGIPTA